MQNVGEKIYNLRTAKGISQEELAEQLNVTRNTVTRWETDVARPSDESFKKLCVFFDVGITYFLTAEEIAAKKEETVEVAQTTEEAVEIVITKEDCAEVGETVVKKESKFKSLKIVLTVVGMVLLGLIIVACGIATYVTIAPAEPYTDSVDIVNYWGIVFLVIGIIGTAILITILVLLLKKRGKQK